jgi:hypothetical protein
LAPHVLPQAPQFNTSAETSSQPFDLTPSQSAVPVGHTQTPASQPCSNAQAMPQFPQFSASTAAFTSQPSTTLRLQSMYPCAHVLVHEALKQVVPGQPVSHERQLRESKRRSAQRPSQHVSAGPQNEQGPASPGAPPESGSVDPPPLLTLPPPPPAPPVRSGAPPLEVDESVPPLLVVEALLPPTPESTDVPPLPPLPPLDDGRTIEKSSSNATGQPTVAKSATVIDRNRLIFPRFEIRTPP